MLKNNNNKTYTQTDNCSYKELVIGSQIQILYFEHRTKISQQPEYERQYWSNYYFLPNNWNRILSAEIGKSG